MSTSQKTAILSEVAARMPSPGTQAYYQTRAMQTFYSYIVRKFLAKEKAGELTRAEFARRARKAPAVITRLLSAPSNMTIATISDLLLALDGERPTLGSEPILGRGLSNYQLAWPADRYTHNVRENPPGNGLGGGAEPSPVRQSPNTQNPENAYGLGRTLENATA